MRIGQVTEVYKPHINGVANFVSLHKHALESMGHEVFVFTLGYEDYDDGEACVFRAPGIPISDTGYHIGLGFPRHVREKIKAMDVLHVHHPFIVGQHAMSMGKRHRIPIVFTNHSRYHILAAHYVPLATEDMSRTFMRAYLSLFTDQCDLVVVPSRGVKKVLREMGLTCHLEVIPNGIDLARFQHPVAPLSKRALGLSEDVVAAITVGRLGPEKNLDFLLHAYVRVVDKVPDLRLVIVGRGPEEESLEALMRSLGLTSRVRLVGEVAYDEIPNWLAMADFFVLPSVSESHPLVVLEALAAGLPVVGIPSPGVEDTIVDGLNGLLSAQDAGAFAVQMCHLAGDADLRGRLASGARETSYKYDIRYTSSALVSHYKRLVDERAAAGEAA
jgi:glycosyltransferase involved in cell wall biosynthesis